MLVAHVAHVFEEVWGRFWMIDVFLGLGWFLAVNWVLFSIPVAFLYFVLRQKSWAYYLSMAYAGFMALQVVWHNIGWLVTGKYFGGFAGAYTSIALLLIGVPLIYYLRKSTPPR